MSERQDPARGFGRAASRPSGGRGGKRGDDGGAPNAADGPELRKLLEGVDVALGALRRELADLPVSIAAQVGARTAPPVDDRARAELLAALERIDEHTSAVRIELRERFTGRLDEIEASLLTALRSRDDVDRMSAGSLVRSLDEIRDRLDARIVSHEGAPVDGFGETLATLREQVSELDRLRNALGSQAAEARADIGRLGESLDEGLAALRRELSVLPASVVADGTSIDESLRGGLLAALRRIDEQTAELRGELTERVSGRLDQVEASVLSALRNRDDVDRMASGSLLRRMEEVREQLEARLAAHDEAAASGLGDTIAALREQVSDLTRLRATFADQADETRSGLTELLDRMSSRQQASLDALEVAAARIESAQAQTRDRFTEAVTETLGAMDAATQRSREVAEQQGAAVQAALAEVRALLGDAHAFTDVGIGQVQTAVDELRSALRDSAGEVRGALGESETLLRDIVRDTRAATTASLEETRGILETNTAATQEALTDATNAVLRGLDDRLESLRSWVSQAPTRLEAVLRAHGEESQSSTELLGREVATLAEQVRTGARHEVDRLTAAVTDARTAMADLGATLGTDLGERVVESRTALEQAVRWLESALAEQSAAVQSAERARTAADEAAQRRVHEVAEQVDSIRTVVSDAAGAVSGVEGSLADVRRSVDRVGTELAGQVSDAVRSSAASELRRLAEAVATVQTSMDRAAETVDAGLRERLEAVRSIADSMTAEVRRDLAATVADDRAAVRASLDQLEASARGVAAGLSAAVVEHVETLRSASGSELSSLAASARSVRQAVEEVGRQLGDALIEQEAAARSLTERLGDRLASLAESTRLATENESEQMQEAVARVRTELSQHAAESRLAMDAVVGRLERVVVDEADATGAAATRVVEGTRTLTEAASVLRQAADDLTPALAEAVDDVVATLRETAAAERVELREGMQRVREETERIGADLQSSLARHIAEARDATGLELAGLTTSVEGVRTSLAEQLDDARTASLAEVASLKQSVDETKAVIARDLHELQLVVDEVVGRLEAVMAKQTATLRRTRGDES